MSGCADKPQELKVNDSQIVTIRDTVSHLLKTIEISSVDTPTYNKLQCGLYIDKDGTVAYKAVDNSYKVMDSPYNKGPIDSWLYMVYGGDLTDIDGPGLKEMRYVVDTLTFKFWGFYYFKDKRHIYNYNVMMDGGTIAVLQEADLKSFHIIKEDEQYAVDRKHCYFRGSVIEGAEPKSFKILDTSYSLSIAYDRRHYYDGTEKMSLTEIKEQDLDSIRQKNSLQHCIGIRRQTLCGRLGLRILPPNANTFP